MDDRWVAHGSSMGHKYVTSVSVKWLSFFFSCQFHSAFMFLIS